MERILANIDSTHVRRGIPIALVVIALLHSVYTQRVFLFQLSPRMVSRMTYGLNPFPESLVIAKYVKEHTSEKDRIAVIGSEPQIYFYSKRLSATGYIYTYPLMENHKYALKMQQEMIREIESARPEFLIFVNAQNSWGRRAGSESLIFDWFDQYQREHFNIAGVADIISSEKTVYLWGDESIGYLPWSNYWVAIYKRKK